MAQHKSALKRIRQTVRRTAVNRARKGRIHTFLKKVDEAIAGGDKEVARAALSEAEPELMRGVSRGVLKHNTASRRISRLSARVKAMPS